MRRGLLLAIYLGGFVLLGAILLSGGSPLIEEIAVEGGERINASEVYAQSGLRVGISWNASARKSALQALRHLPQLKNVEIQTERTHRGRVRVRISLEEREPYGIMALEGRGLFWVDREGYLLSSLEAEPYLPVITGLNTLKTLRGERIASEDAIRILQEFYSLSGRTLSLFTELGIGEYHLEVSSREGWVALLPKEGLKLQLARLEAILAALGAEDWRILDLRFEGEVIIRR